MLWTMIQVRKKCFKFHFVDRKVILLTISSSLSSSEENETSRTAIEIFLIQIKGI